MSFIKLMYKAYVLDKHKQRLLHEKKYASSLPQDGNQGKQVKIKEKHKFHKKLLNLAQRCTVFRKETKLYRFCFKLRHDGSCENYVLKSIVGFIGGFILTYMFFMFFVFQLNFKFSTATIMCSIFGSILTIGLAFSYNVRCIVFLTLPQLFSKRGRQALLAYAFILAITGPAKNTLNNMGILSESLACGQEQLKQAVKQILEVVKKPFYAIKDAIKSVVKVVKQLVKKIKEILLAIKRVIVSILKVIKAMFQFLARLINICNKELGTPFQRCTRVFESAIVDCHAKLGPMFSWLCSIAFIAQAVCYTVKIFDFICELVDYIGNSLVGVVIKKVKNFIRHIKTMFYVRIRFSHSFHFETNSSKTIEDVAAGIVTEIKERTEGLMKVFDFMSCATSLFFLFIVVRVLYYRYKFLSDERFDNRYITKDFRAIDVRRAQLGKESVLPLNKRERNVYISVNSIRLVKKEKIKLSQTSVVLGMASLKLGTHMIADYALFWVLTLIRQHASFQSSYDGSNIPKIQITGQGLFADLLRSIVKAFQPVGINLEIDTVPCLPDAIPPDFDRYVQIASLLVICWILAVFEPYGMRWRNSVMCFYHPLRAKQRAIWLYNHVLRTRTSFLKFVRRQLRRRFGGDKSIEKVTCKEYINAFLLRFKICHSCLKPMNQTACLLCGEIFREYDTIKPIRCQTPNCPGVYCEKCFEDLQNLCTICLDPIQYGDFSDVSEEKDSSEDIKSRKLSSKKTKKKKRKRKKRKKRKWIRIFRKDKTDTDTDTTTSGVTNTGTKSLYSVHDSDYFSTDTSISSYGYQYKKDVTKQQPMESTRSRNTDIEKQTIPDYVSMETFRRDLKNENILSSTLATFGSHSFPPSKESIASKGSFIEKYKQSLKSMPGLLDTDDDSIPLLDLDLSETSEEEIITRDTSSETTYIESSSEISRWPKRHRRELRSSSETTFIETGRGESSKLYYCTNTEYETDSSLEIGVATQTTTGRIKKIDKAQQRPTNRSVGTSMILDPLPPIDVPKLDLQFTASCQCGCGTEPCTCHRLYDTSSYHTETETGRSSKSNTLSVCELKANTISTQSQIYSPQYSTSSWSSPEKTVTYLYKAPNYIHKKTNQEEPAKSSSKGSYQHTGNWETISNTPNGSKSYREKVKNYYAAVNRSTLKQVVKKKKISKIREFFKKLFKTDNFNSSPTRSRLTKSFLSESEEATPQACSPRTKKFQQATTREWPRFPSNSLYRRQVGKFLFNVYALFMGSSVSSKQEAEYSSDSEAGGDTQSVRRKSDIEAVFGWYDSTDSDISELQHTPRRKCCSKNNSLKKTYMQAYRDKKKCSTNCESETKDTSSTGCCCTRDTITLNAQTVETGTDCRTTSQETNDKTQMNIDKKRAQLDRYSREPPERDQNFENNCMKLNENRCPYDHNDTHGCSCNGQAECKFVKRVPNFSAHPHYSSPSQRCPSNHHSPRNQQSSCSQHIPRKQQSVHSQNHPHNSHSPQDSRSPANQHSPHNQHQSFNYNFQNYNHSPSYKQQQHCQQYNSCPINKRFPSNCSNGKRTTYDMAKSAENLRQAEQCRIVTNHHPPPPKTVSHSSPEVGKHKQMAKHGITKSDSSDYFGNVGYPPKYPYEEPMQDRDDDGHDRNCSCDCCHHMHRNYYRNCKCYDCNKPFEEPLSSFSDESANNRNVNLAYQKTDDYPVLVDEIETTISQRNKERVRNTMRQFELLSRQNKSLEKPIYDDDENESHCTRYCSRTYSPVNNSRCNEHCPNIHTRSETLSSRPTFSPTPFPRNRGYVEKVARYMDPSLADNTQKYPKFNREPTNTRWQMDPRTGEWYKVYDENQYDFQNNYPPLPDTPSPQYSPDVYQKNPPPMQGYYGTPHQVRTKSPNKHHHHMPTKTCGCMNCVQGRY